MLTNRKPEHRQGQVQLIDATQWFKPLRKNLGKKNCELADEDIQRICDTFLAFEETEQSKIFDNAAFGYWKVTVERPLRIAGAETGRAYKAKEIKELKESGTRSEDILPIIKKIHKKGTEADPMRGLFAVTIDGKPAVVEYEPDADLRETWRDHCDRITAEDVAKWAPSDVFSADLGPRGHWLCPEQRS